MVLTLSKEVEEDVRLLTRLPPAGFKEFCKISIENILQGAANRNYAKAAESLKVDVDAVQRAVDGLSEVFIEASKRSVGDEDLQVSLTQLQLSPEAQKILLEFYHASSSDIRTLLSGMAMKLPSYVGLDWRLDVQLASRCLRQQANPSFLLRLETTNPDPISHTLECDFANLHHVSEQLQAALAQVKTTHSKRILRYLR